MSANRIPTRTASRPSADERLVAVESVVDRLALPTARPLIVRDDAVHAVVADAEEFAAWLYYLGGDVNRAPALDGASLWTLRTETPRRADGGTVRILVHTVAVHDEPVPAAFHPGVPA